MICSICLGESNQLPMYSCGHHFHAKCLHTAALHGKREAEQLDRPFKTIVQCPYCRQYIDLFKSTRTDNNYIKFNNELEIENELERLIGKKQMGDLFKCIVVSNL